MAQHNKTPMCITGQDRHVTISTTKQTLLGLIYNYSVWGWGKTDIVHRKPM